jgi:uncharacterized protein YigA (DUF484 family)
MTRKKGKSEPSELGDTFEKEVIAYLEAQPDFFERHPELVESLRVPHACGGAISLIEHQVEVLKEKNRAYRHKMRELVEIARENDRLSEKMQLLTLELFACKSVDDIVMTVHDSLRNQFDMDLIRIMLIGSPKTFIQGYVDSVDPGSALLKSFETFFKGERPVCGRLKKEQLKHLFAEQGEKVKSATLIPLIDDTRYGLIAMGSFDADRFNPGMGTLFLRHLGAVVTRVLKLHQQS